MQPILKDRVIRAAPMAVWAALTDPQAIRAWMGGEGTIEFDLRHGGRYRLFGGETTGTLLSFETGRSLCYTWRQGEWPPEWEDSRVEWTLTAVDGGTRLHLVHDQFPNQQERDAHDEGWDEYFLGPLQETLEQPR
jgi:uncharacterized protein YndB with AHSA1/START domain